MDGTQVKNTQWDVRQAGDDKFVAVRTQEVVISGAASSAEAKIELLKTLGGEVDIRGYHKQGETGQKLKELTAMLDR
jgi:hypothetical protein